MCTWFVCSGVAAHRRNATSGFGLITGSRPDKLLTKALTTQSNRLYCQKVANFEKLLFYSCCGFVVFNAICMLGVLKSSGTMHCKLNITEDRNTHKTILVQKFDILENACHNSKILFLLLSTCPITSIGMPIQFNSRLNRRSILLKGWQMCL